MKSAFAHLALLGAILLAFVASYFSDYLDPYFLRVIVTVGINIILAVSLNLVNGYTGQFSLGHAGFMCVGAYTSAVLTMFVAPKLFGNVLPVGEWNSAFFFVCGIIIAGMFRKIMRMFWPNPSVSIAR